LGTGADLASLTILQLMFLDLPGSDADVLGQSAEKTKRPVQADSNDTLQTKPI
jgi:hypothetical protein